MTSMRPLVLNHMAPGRTARRASVTMLLLALAGNIVGGLYYSDLKDQRISATRGTSTRSLDAPNGAGRGVAGGLQKELSRADDLVRASNVPWDALFGAIEAAGNAEVSLLSFDPTPEKKMLKLQAEARNMEAVLVYLRALSAEPVFSSVSLQSHQVQQADPNHPVRILVLLEWRAAP